MKTTYTLLIFILLSHFSWANVGLCEDDFALNTCDQDDYVALRALYLSTDGDNWVSKTGWPDAAFFNTNPTLPAGIDVSAWWGVTVDANGCVSELFFHANQLNGSVPTEIGNMTNLTKINFRHNQLSGNLPAEIWDLTNLTLLLLTNNQLIGNVPVEVGNLTNLIELELSDNQFSGNLPIQIWYLPSLEILALNFNQFTGTIPADVENLSNLTLLQLAGNQFTGELPPEIGNLTNLDFLWLYSNQFTGSIPAEFGNLNLVSIGLPDNQLSGCYDVNLTNLCEGLIFFNTNQYVSFMNNFDVEWEDFCNTGAGTCCPSSLIIVNTIPNSRYQAGVHIISNGIVPMDDNVSFKAGQYILLDNNFTVEPNADFSAEIEDCGF